MKKRRVAGSPIGRGGPSFEAMQLLDSSDLGLRSARLTFRSSNSPVTITLFPMVHLGGASFYDAVHKDAGAHDAMLLEGIRSPVAARITRAYRWIEGAKRIGLVVQPRPSAQSLAPAAVIHADLPKDEFERHWRKVPLYLRLVLYAGLLSMLSIADGSAAGQSSPRPWRSMISPVVPRRSAGSQNTKRSMRRS